MKDYRRRTNRSL